MPRRGAIVALVAAGTPMARLLRRLPARRRASLRLGSVAAALRRRQRPAWLGSLGATTPFAGQWGYDRGTPVDRWYIERFLAAHGADIRGHVLEVKDAGYTERFGRGVSDSAVLDVDAGNPRATLVGDLVSGDGLPGAAFDCFVLTQTLQYLADPRAALANARRLLRPGGVLLATLPVTSRICDTLTDHWRFTPVGARSLFDEAFGRGAVHVEAHGNVLAQVAFLEGLAAEDLTPGELAFDDALYPLVVCVRAVRGR
jgi:SAM-dependent methyltransferase